MCDMICNEVRLLASTSDFPLMAIELLLYGGGKRFEKTSKEVMDEIRLVYG